MPRVFVTQETDKNLSLAKTYGQFIVLLSNKMIYGKSRQPDYLALYKLISQRMDEHEFDIGDIIIPIGDPILIGLVISRAIEITDGQFSVLKWDRERGEYDLVRLDIPEL